MITHIVKRPRRECTRPSISNGQRVYCIGNIHGRVDLLEDMHQQTLTDAEVIEGKKYVAYLGDFVDRRPDTEQVLDLLLAWQAKSWAGPST